MSGTKTEWGILTRDGEILPVQDSAVECGDLADYVRVMGRALGCKVVSRIVTAGPWCDETGDEA